jgi:hypothetical protein
MRLNLSAVCCNACATGEICGRISAWDSEPMVLRFDKIRHHGIVRAVFCDEALNHVIDRLQVGGIVERIPLEKRQNIVAGPGLCLSGSG